MVLNVLLPEFLTLGGKLSGKMCNIVIMNLWKSDIPVSRVKQFSKLFELFVRKRSMYDELLKLLKLSKIYS